MKEIKIINRNKNNKVTDKYIHKFDYTLIVIVLFLILILMELFAKNKENVVNIDIHKCKIVKGKLLNRFKPFNFAEEFTFLTELQYLVCHVLIIIFQIFQFLMVCRIIPKYNNKITI